MQVASETIHLQYGQNLYVNNGFILPVPPQSPGQVRAWEISLSPQSKSGLWGNGSLGNFTYHVTAHVKGLFPHTREHF